MHYRKIIVYIFCLSIFLELSCYKKFDVENNDYYFLRGVIFNGYPPVFKFYKNSMSKETELSLDLLDLRVSDEFGNVDTMVNGAFLFLRVMPNVEYEIQWKFKTSDDWNRLKKRSIDGDKSQINSSNVKIDDNISLSFNSSFNTSVFYSALRINYKNATVNNTLIKAADQIGFLNSTIDKKNFLEADLINNSIILYPPKNRIEYPSQNLSSCLKPFHYVTSPRYEEFALFEMSKKDFDLLYQINISGLKAAEPLYIGEPLPIDYRKNDMLAHVFFIQPYEDIIFKNYLPKTGIVTYEFKKNNVPLDTVLYQDAKLLYTFENTSSYSYPYSNNARKGELFFKDKIADEYNTKFSQSCGFYKADYKLNLYVVYREFLSGKIIVYNVPNQYLYNYQNEHLIIDIP